MSSVRFFSFTLTRYTTHRYTGMICNSRTCKRASSTDNNKELDSARYDEDFNPTTYLQEWMGVGKDFTKLLENHNDRSVILFPMNCYHEFFSLSQLKHTKNLSFLDYGCGPTLSTLISAAPHVSEVIMSDYSSANREYVQKWVNGDDMNGSWNPFFEYVVHYLERNDKPDAVKERVQLVRNIIKAVVPCDITNNLRVVQDGYQGPYDIVHCKLTLCVTSESTDDYKEQVKRLSKLVKPGGHLVFIEAERKMDREYRYQHAGRLWKHLGVSREFVGEVLKEAGFTDIYEKTSGHGDKTKIKNYMCFTAVKQS